MFILATEVQQNIEQNVEELDKKVSRLSTLIDDGINKAIDFGFDLLLAIIYHSFRYSRSFHRFGITGKSCKLCRRYTYTYN